MIISSRLQPSANQKRILRVLLSELAMEDAFFRKDLKARQKPDDQDQANRAQKRRVVQVIRAAILSIDPFGLTGKSLLITPSSLQ